MFKIFAVVLPLSLIATPIVANPLILACSLGSVVEVGDADSFRQQRIEFLRLVDQIKIDREHLSVELRIAKTTGTSSEKYENLGRNASCSKIDLQNYGNNLVLVRSCGSVDAFFYNKKIQVASLSYLYAFGGIVAQWKCE